MSFLQMYNRYLTICEDYFKTQLNFQSNRLTEAVSYSFNGGGKRLRPVLMIACAEYLGVSFDDILPFCFSIECVHQHSLVHDDLPSLDNDFTRRGKPCCHVAFNEATAILAGDALLNLAYEKCLIKCDNLNKVSALNYLSLCTGEEGMLLGQTFDTCFDGEESQEKIFEIYQYKTSKLFSACLVVPCILSGNNILIDKLEELGKNLGLLFQLTDDIIDYKDNLKSLNKNELNFANMFGLDSAIKLKTQFKDNCLKIFENLNDFTFIKLFIDYIAERTF